MANSVTGDDVRTWLVEAVSRTVQLRAADIDPAASFDQYGISSAEAVSISGELEQWLGTALSPTVLYDHPTINGLAGFLGGTGPTAPAAAPRGRVDLDPICLVGMACRFPGAADTTAQFWQNLLGAVDAAAEVPADRWDAAAHYSADLNEPGKSYTKLGGFVSDVAGFDPAFFGLSPREAQRMEPQQRMLLEVAWSALEDAGLAADRLRGSRTAVYVGMMAGNQYGSLLTDGEGQSVIDDPYFGMGIAPSVAAGRLSYLLDLRGPAVSVDTACSSSLVAVHLAARALRDGEADLAIVGGVSALLHPDTLRQASKMRMLAADGRCKTFDSDADGFLMGEGCGVVVLERQSAAVAAGHRVLAVLRGSAVNQDGASNGMTAPNGPAQTAVLRDALAAAGVAPDDVDYVEAHGSGTLLGDSIEMSSLHEVFGANRDAARPLVVGAVKTNVGHLTGAAGMAGLIKTVLAMRHGRIPPNLHLRTPNPNIAWESCPTLLPNEVVDWPERDGRRISGVSSFGWSGTNVHCVLEAPPVPDRPVWAAAPATVLLSARNWTALSTMAGELAERLRAEPHIDLADVAFTTQTGRAALDHRVAVTADSVSDAVTQLTHLATTCRTKELPRGRATDVAFLLPGSGDQYEGMGAGLYRYEPVFRAAVDRCAELTGEHLGKDIRELIYPSRPRPAAAGGMSLAAMLGRDRDAAGVSGSPLADRLDMAHVAVFAIDYACATLWMHWGVRPARLLGYSLGEYVAACLSGVLTLPDALDLVIRRARLVQSTPGGAMLAVAQSAAEVESRLVTGLSLAAVNGPRMCVVAGTEAAVSTMEQRLRAEHITSRRIPSTHAMHSSLLEPLAPELAELVGSYQLSEPTIPFVSNVTGTWITPEQAVDPGYWAKHMCQTVQFGPGVLELASRTSGVLLETGPGQLASLARQILAARRDLGVTVCSTLPASGTGVTDRRSWLAAAGELWSSGVPVDWRAASGERPCRTVSLPAYPFEHQRFWPRPATPGAAAVPAPLAEGKPADLADWCYAPAWRQSVGLMSTTDPAAHSWLLLADQHGLIDRLAELLSEHGAAVTLVRHGELASPAAYAELVAELAARQRFPDRVVHAFSAGPVPVASLSRRLARTQERGVHSVLDLVRALAAHQADRSVSLFAVSSGAREVVGGDGVSPDKATILGPVKTVTQEFPNIQCRSVDLPSPDPGEWFTDTTVRQLFAEVCAESTEDMVAFRGNHRWVQDFQPVRIGAPAQPVWRPGGVYLITGGTGELGLMLAGYLHRTVGARLALLSRSPLPPREHWTREIEARPHDDPLRRRLIAMRELEAADPRILHLIGDVSDPEAVAAAIGKVDAEFGELHGVIHAAGVPGGGLIQRNTAADLANVLRPKVSGTAVLCDALAGRQLDFLALFSSAVVATGGLGESGYCAANSFLDELAAATAGTGGTPVVSIDWGPWQRDAWQSATLATMPRLQAAMRDLRDEYGIADDEGTALLSRILGSGRSRMLVLPQEVGAFAKRWSRFATLDALSTQETPAADRYPRPDLGSAFVSARTDTERRVADIWAEHLGLTQVGIDDVFFELGGNSLIGLTITTRLEREFGRSIPAATLFEAPTIRTFSELLAGDDKPASLDNDTGRGANRRNRLAGAAARRGRRGPT